MEGIYQVQAYLHSICKASSPLCPHFSSNEDETFTHFTSVCPKFLEARTSAHNQARRVITAFLARNIGRRWKMFEESSLKNTGLVLRPVSTISVAQALRQPTDNPESEQDLGPWQPDRILVSSERKKIAILDLCRPSDVHLRSKLQQPSKNRLHPAGRGTGSLHKQRMDCSCLPVGGWRPRPYRPSPHICPP